MQQKSNICLKMRSQGQGHRCRIRAELWEGEVGSRCTSRAVKGSRDWRKVHTAPGEDSAPQDGKCFPRTRLSAKTISHKGCISQWFPSNGSNRVCIELDGDLL